MFNSNQVLNFPAYKVMSEQVRALQLIKLIIEEQMCVVLHQPPLLCVVCIIRLPGCWAGLCPYSESFFTVAETDFISLVIAIIASWLATIYKYLIHIVQ